MTVRDYYNILGLTASSSVEEIKKAYRQKARLYHPDINPSPGAKDMFIIITEAYEFLIAYKEKIGSDDEEYNKAMEEWKKYRQDRSRQRATAFARTSYVNFKKTKFYKTTRIFDGTTIIFSFAISIMVLILSVYGFTYRIRHPDPGLGKPSVLGFIMILLLGIIFFAVSFIYLKAFLETSGKFKKKA
jgi:hypothetical protein